MSEQENQFLTTGEDIRKLLTRCKKCYSITNNGNYVIFHTKLLELIIPKKKKIGIIVNSQADERLVGHWFTICVYQERGERHCYLADGLDQIRKEPEILKNIKSFCTNNHLTFSSISVRLQLKSSKKCGFIALFWIFQLSISSLNAFKNLRKIMIQQSIHSNEARALRLVKKHFKIISL